METEAGIMLDCWECTVTHFANVVAPALPAN